MSRPFDELRSVAEFVNGAAFKPEDWGESGARIIRIQNLTDRSKPFNHTTRVVPEKVHVRRGDLLVSWSASLGVFEWNEPDVALLNQHIFRVIPDDSKVDKRYLRYGLELALLDMQRHLHGATMQHVNRDEFLSTRIYLPPLPEQRRIAAILDKADALRAKRGAALEQLNGLTQSAFLEMFGDPATNPKGWKTGVLGDVVHSASDGPHVSPKYVDAGVGVPFLSTRHVRRGELVWDDLKFISREDALLHWKKCKPERGDILYTKGGTTGVAKAVDFDAEIAIWVHISLLKTNRALVEPRWLEEMLNSAHCYAQSQVLTHGIANRDLGLKRMVRIRLFIPPIDIQRDFVRRASTMETLTMIERESQQKFDTLFLSLQHRAFAGAL